MPATRGRRIPLKRWTAFLLACWTIVCLSFGIYVFHLVNQSTLAQVHTKALEAFNKDKSFRLWGTMHGGVYVPVTPKTPPNRYLEKSLERNLVTPRGKELTLMNPAYMVRQLNESFSGLYGVKGHITSLRPLRPENGPDAWEAEALWQFEKGIKEIYEIVDEGGQQYARLMRPMPVIHGCLKCHGHQGYEVGDVRGGVSVKVPVAPFLPAATELKTKSGGFLTAIWFIGSGIILMGSTLLNRNLRERDALTRHLQEARESADTANKAKTVFLANMSHEIRTPLNGIMGMIQLLKSTGMNGEQKEYADTALQSSKRLTQLLSDILDLSMVETGVIEFRREPLKLKTVFDNVNASFATSTKHGAVDLEFSLDPDIPEFLMGDTVRLQQILSNLVGNAIKFTHSGTIKVEAAKVSAADQKQCRILFSVSDTGCGIDSDKLDSIFKPFIQIDEGYTRSYQGAGLGLAICKQLVEARGGNMAISSEPDSGTTIHISIPFDVPTSIPTPQSQQFPDNEFPSLNLKILLAEDDRINRLVAQRLLCKMGCDVTSVSNGLLAIEALRDDDYDLVIMDIQMPVMDGLETLKAIREGEAGMDKQNITIIAMTAYAMVEDAKTFLKAGMDDYIPKPINAHELLTIIQQNTNNKPPTSQSVS